MGEKKRDSQPLQEAVRYGGNGEAAVYRLHVSGGV